MSFSLGEYQDIFLEEADELLQELNQNLLELEKNPENDEIINNIFRAAHSLKSSAAFVGLNDLSDLAHKMENLLQGIRDKTNDITSDVVDVIFKCFDVISAVIEKISSGQAPDQDLKPLIDRINIVTDSSKKSRNLKKEDYAPEKVAKTGSAALKISFTKDESSIIKQSLAEGGDCFEVSVDLESAAQMKWVKAQLISTNLEKEGTIVKVIPSIDDMIADDSISSFKVIIATFSPVSAVSRGCNVDQLEKVEIKPISVVQQNGKQVLKIGKAFDDELFLNGKVSNEKPARSDEISVTGGDITFDDLPGNEDADEASDENDSADSLIAEEELDIFDRRQNNEPVINDRRKGPVLKTVKVSIDKLDLLLNNVGELVIANSGFYRLYEEMRKFSELKGVANEFKNRMEQMSRIAKDLQTGIMKTRMVPVGQVFSRFNRLVRDLAKEHNKNVELIIRGEETELDKKVIDVIGEPLLHLIRNAVDHGIETKDERIKLGKNEMATITLNAYQGGNQIFVEISDDGRGLDLDAIKEKILEKKMSTPEMLVNMDEQDVYNFIFTPGFSTAKRITDISGRGVGMNVVKEIVNELNGNVAIETEKSMGTRFVLTFPLTLAIIPAIMVKVRHEVYAIPLSDVVETIKISTSDIATIEGHEVINLRGEILSLLRLNEFVNLKSSLGRNQKIPVVVVGFGNRKIGLIVDSLEGKMEIVIKSLEQNYKNVEGLAGASILGDGSICLILDIQTMINRVIIQQEKLTPDEKQRIFKSRSVDYDDVEDAEDAGSVRFKKEESKSDITEDIPEKSFKIKHDKTADVSDMGSRAASGKPNYISDVILFDDDTSDEKPSDAVPSSEKESSLTAKEEIVAPEAEDSVPEGKEDSREAAVIPESDTVPAEEEDGRNINKKVHAALAEFKDELRQNITSAVSSGSPDDHMGNELDISKEELNEFNLISNMGAATAAESLSKILNRRIDLAIPEVKITPIEKIPDFFGDLNEPYMGVLLGIEGEINGSLLFVLQENVGYDLVDMLYGKSESHNRELSEDGVSALKELTNIIGSSILNVYAEKSMLVVKPNVPTFVHDFLQSIIDSILVMHNMEHEYAIVMETAFYFEDDRIVGNLMILPEAESLKNLVSGIKKNVISD
jgi:two-component system chemotaxis sensor kinase CheA